MRNSYGTGQICLSGRRLIWTKKILEIDAEFLFFSILSTPPPEVAFGACREPRISPFGSAVCVSRILPLIKGDSSSGRVLSSIGFFTQRFFYGLLGPLHYLRLRKYLFISGKSFTFFAHSVDLFVIWDGECVGGRRGLILIFMSWLGAAARRQDKQLSQQLE